MHKQAHLLFDRFEMATMAVKLATNGYQRRVIGKPLWWMVLVRTCAQARLEFVQVTLLMAEKTMWSFERLPHLDVVSFGGGHGAEWCCHHDEGLDGYSQHVADEPGPTLWEYRTQESSQVESLQQSFRSACWQWLSVQRAFYRTGRCGLLVVLSAAHTFRMKPVACTTLTGSIHHKLKTDNRVHKSSFVVLTSRR
jgi:hypothetical protein